MPNFNSITLVGHLTRDVELRNTQGGTAVAAFGMAVNRRWSQNGEKKESVMFIDCKVWGRKAEVLAQFVKKGDPLLIDGYLELETWDDKATGAKRSKHVAVAMDFTFLKPRDAATNSTHNDEYGEVPF